MSKMIVIVLSGCQLCCAICHAKPGYLLTVSLWLAAWYVCQLHNVSWIKLRFIIPVFSLKVLRIAVWRTVDLLTVLLCTGIQCTYQWCVSLLSEISGVLWLSARGEWIQLKFCDVMKYCCCIDSHKYYTLHFVTSVTAVLKPQVSVVYCIVNAVHRFLPCFECGTTKRYTQCWHSVYYSCGRWHCSWLSCRDRQSTNTFTRIAALNRSCYYQLCQLRPIIRSLSTESTRTLVQAFISCCLDYCNSLLYGISNGLLWRLQSVQIAAARLVTGTRIRFKLAGFVFQSLKKLPA